MLGRHGPLPVLVAALMALVLVPGSMSATDGAGESQPGVDALSIALDHVTTNAADLGVTRADVANLVVTTSYRSTASGVTHVNLNQRFRGLEVFGGHVTVNVGRDGKVVFAAGSLVDGLTSGASGDEDLGPTQAVEAAAEGLDLDDPANLRILSQSGGPAQKTVVSNGGISEGPIPARLGWQPTADGLRLAWQVTIDDSSDVHLWNATVDAETGELLAAEDWTNQDSLGDLAQTLARTNLTTQAATTYPVSPNPVLDGSSYRVFRLPDESPNDAPRQLVENPADGLASPFGWHDTNGVPGAEFTITRGNNNHAYLDQDDNEQEDFGGSPSGGPGLDFDFPVDFSQHSQAYREAVTTNLFYGCNIDPRRPLPLRLRRGVGQLPGQQLRPRRPRRRLRSLRGGRRKRHQQRQLLHADGADARHGRATDADVPVARQPARSPEPARRRRRRRVRRHLGAVRPAGHARRASRSDAGVRRARLSGLELPEPRSRELDRGGGRRHERVRSARSSSGRTRPRRRAPMPLVVVHTSDDPPIMGGSFVAAPPGIPTVAVGATDGAAIKAAIAAGPKTGNVRKHPAHPGIRDGDFDTGIIFHEYGHGVSNRLTGGPAVNCLSGNEQAGEGWSDFLAISLLLNPELDDPAGTRGLVPYVLFQANRSGNGLRPRPYSRTMETQPFTYDSIKTNGWLNGTSLALPHGLGHGWAAVLWDMTWDQIDKHGFNPNVYEAWNTGGNNRAHPVRDRRAEDAGLRARVWSSSSRAIIAAGDELSDGEDTCMLWASFARRGLGFSAVQGTTNRNDNSEAYDTAPQCLRGFQSPVVQPYGQLNEVDAGDAVPLKFTRGRLQAAGRSQGQRLAVLAQGGLRDAAGARARTRRSSPRGSSRSGHRDPGELEADGEPAGGLPLQLEDARRVGGDMP